MLDSVSQSSVQREKIVKYTAFCIGLGFLLWRAPYGFCYNDEPFCITLAQRMWLGDALIVDEWHGVQNFGPVLLPLYAIFRLFTPSNQGIILVFRYIYCFCWWLTCVFTSKTVEKMKPGYMSLLSFLYLVLFSPLDYMSISYTSLGLMCSLLLCDVFFSIPGDKQWKHGRIVFSILWIVLTLCSPIMAVAYLISLMISLIGLWRTKTKMENWYFRNLWYLYRFSVVFILFTVVIYLYVFLLSRADFSEIVESIPYIFQDPEHQSIDLRETIYNVLHAALTDNGVYFVLSGLCFLFGLLKSVRKHRLMVFSICTLCYLYAQLDYFDNKLNLALNQQVLYIVFLGAVAFSFLENKPVKLFAVFYGFSAVYTICNCLMSNTGLMSISMTLSVAGVAAIIFICLLLQELKEEYPKKTLNRFFAIAMVCAVMVVQVGTQIGTRLYRTYWDKPLTELTQTIEVGAAKGLKTNSEQANAYETMYYNLTALMEQTDTEEKSFESWTCAPYVYLDANLAYATFSAWNFGYGDTLDQRILSYQEVNPDKVPDLVFCASEEDMLPLNINNYEIMTFNGAKLLVKR